MAKKSLSLIGFGSFSKFIVPFLTPHFDVYAWNRSEQSTEAIILGVNYVSLKEALGKEIIILSTNISFFESLLSENHAFFNPDALVLDVASVKIKPVQLMLKYLPQSCEIIGTHPLFGPQSGKNGVHGLNIVYCPVRAQKHHDCVYEFLATTLKLNVMVLSPEEHDKYMAYVQGLTHFIGRAVANMDIPDLVQKTKAYQSLLDIKTMLGGDSYELFKSIENENPFAREVRDSFMAELALLNQRLTITDKL